MAQLKHEPEKVEKALEETRENVEKKIFSDELNKKFLDLEMATNTVETAGGVKILGNNGNDAKI